jgi:hypothetical protein
MGTRSPRTTAWPSRALRAPETREGFEATFPIVLPLRGPVTSLLPLRHLPSVFRRTAAPCNSRPYQRWEPGMDQEVHRLNRYTEELLADRRPTREVLPNGRAFHARQAAALLSGIRPGADIPSRRFLTRVEGQIARWIREGTQRPVIVSALGGVASGLLHTPGVRRLQPLPRSLGRCRWLTVADLGRRRYRARAVWFKDWPRS